MDQFTMNRRTRLVYSLLAVACVLVAAWQAFEHYRVKEAARAALINRSRAITTTLGLVIRSQRRFGMVSQERMESALGELVRSGELNGVALLNASGDVVASAGTPLLLERGMMQRGEHWNGKSVTLINLVDLGTTVSREGETNRPTIVLPRRESAGANRPDDRPTFNAEARPPPAEGRGAGPAGATDSAAQGASSRERSSGWRFGRPPRMDEKEYQSLLEQRGLHGLVIAMSTENFLRITAHDLLTRWVIGCFATVSALGFGFAWRNLVRSSDLQMRLIRASEMNAHLREMNLAAAGLAHETRNPLNIIRGLAQMISKQPDASPEVRGRTLDIIDETDRVTAQLNEFINYSRPREVRRSRVALAAVIGEVARALSYDLQEKAIELRISPEQLAIEADEQLLRQALFNLVLNAIQAVELNGTIEIRLARQGPSEAWLEVRDNGPGVPVEHRADIFKPYFTTHQKGTGLGLAVVQQIVLAHGWEIVCLENDPRGAIFRITHLRALSSSGPHAA
jgi:signal transduction histidine kinase